MPTAIATVVISTIVQDQATSKTIVEHLRHDVRAASARADAIAALDSLGWVLLRQPEGVDQGDDYTDVLAYWAKDFDLPTDAERDLALAGAFEEWNFSLGWNYRGGNDAHGAPDCEWWSEGPSHEYIVKTFGKEADRGNDR